MMGDPELVRRMAMERQASIACEMQALRTPPAARAGVALGDVGRAWLIAVQTTEAYLRSIHLVR